MNEIEICPSHAQPLGVSLVDGGFVNIAVRAPAARAVFLCVFDGPREVARLRLPEQTDGVHHGRFGGLPLPLYYGLRAAGEYAPSQGWFYDEAKLLIDPYARQLSGPLRYDDALSGQNFGVDTAPLVPRAVFDPAAPKADLVVRARVPQVIYEAQVRALTMLHPAVPPHVRGTVAAFREPCVLEHLLKIGVDTLELMPITAWLNERHLHHLGLHNAWGYNPVAMMALDPTLCPNGMAELRETVAALRAAGIQTVLDVVFNHTAESDVDGPVVSMRGLDNRYYYRHDEMRRLVNDTGCGNTLDCSQSGVADLVIDSLRYFVQTAGVAGFRFDLAPILGRLATGFAVDAPLLQRMRDDDVLSQVLLIAEPWDVGLGGYQLGQFGAPWLEWNDQYRNDVRHFWHGTGTASRLATRLAGSSDVFARRSPVASVNFVGAHDGFCLRDLVSYNQKHNEANGEDNRDGSNDNVSWNNGCEGVTTDAAVTARRARDVRALLATLFVSQGTVMLCAGDELGKTQGGNNNAYAQDNATTWLDWDNADHALIDYVAELAQLRRRHPLLRQTDFLRDCDVTWLRADAQPMNEHDWHNNSLLLGMCLHGVQRALLVYFNAHAHDVAVQLPALPWRNALDVVPARSVVWLETENT
ncbi:MAG: glycogen debranching protein GlgX [Formosimonas sp.]